MDENEYNINAIADAEDREYLELVSTVFNSVAGQKLQEHFKEYLMKPNWFPHEPSHVGLYREGSCQFIRELLGDIQEGSELLKGK